MGSVGQDPSAASATAVAAERVFRSLVDYCLRDAAGGAHEVRSQGVGQGLRVGVQGHLCQRR